MYLDMEFVCSEDKNNIIPYPTKEKGIKNDD
jgi:hypothetical protein